MSQEIQGKMVEMVLIAQSTGRMVLKARRELKEKAENPEMAEKTAYEDQKEIKGCQESLAQVVYMERKASQEDILQVRNSYSPKVLKTRF